MRKRSTRLTTIFIAAAVGGALGCQAEDEARDSDPGLPSPDGAFDDPNSPGDDRPSNDPRPSSDPDDDDGGTTDGGDGDTTDGGDEPRGGACCEARTNPGCDDAAVQSTVCGIFSHCCDSKWDIRCVGEAEKLGVCSAATTGASSTGSGSSDDSNASAEDDDGMGGDGSCLSNSDCMSGQTCLDGTCITAGASNGCCVESMTPGCNSDVIMACVCGVDPFCCDSEWDDACVDTVGECTTPCP